LTKQDVGQKEYEKMGTNKTKNEINVGSFPWDTNSCERITLSTKSHVRVKRYFFINGSPCRSQHSNGCRREKKLVEKD
jgi:hypothetical protein